MKLKSPFLIALLMMSLCARAAELSDVTNGIYLAVAAIRDGSIVSNGIIRPDDQLIWMPFCDSGRVRLSYPDPTYGIKISMKGPDGNEVQKTAFGTNFGLKFDDLTDYRVGHLGGIEAWGAYKDNTDLGGGRPLPSPHELFQMEQPGIYAMRMEMQMFRQSSSTNIEIWKANLIHFSPVIIKVEKASNKATKGP